MFKDKIAIMKKNRDLLNSLIICGLLNKSHIKFRNEVVHNENRFLNRITEEIDVNLLIFFYKGLVLNEFKFLKGANSCTLITPTNRILQRRLSASMYCEISNWAQKYFIRSNNYHYLPKNPEIEIPSRHQCVSCFVYEKIPLIERNYTYSKYLPNEELRQEIRKFEINKCPKCEQHILKSTDTRWGEIRRCTNYPICDFIE